VITLFTGAPGAGKTAALVDLLMREYSGRAIYADGLDGLALGHEPLDASQWPTTVPDGALIVIDEVQRVWRPRGAGAAVPASVAALETHRHRGLDFLITTQGPGLLDKNVRALVGRHVHIRDAGILGRYWYEWPECNEGASSWKTAVNKRRWSLPKAAFGQYKSASIHTVPVRTVPRALIVIGVAAVLALAAFGYFYGRVLHPPVTPLPSPVAVDVSVSPQGQLTQTLNGAPDVIMDFVPRLSGHPETAKAYDHLRVVHVLPVITGGICAIKKNGVEICRCFLPGNFYADLTHDECKAVVSKPLPYNPYFLASAAPATSPDRQTGAPDVTIARAVP
jgi:zona occludens toxin